jgi:hypothetical protein
VSLWVAARATELLSVESGSPCSVGTSRSSVNIAGKILLTPYPELWPCKLTRLYETLSRLEWTHYVLEHLHWSSHAGKS